MGSSLEMDSSMLIHSDFKNESSDGTSEDSPIGRMKSQFLNQMEVNFNKVVDQMLGTVEGISGDEASLPIQHPPSPASVLSPSILSEDKRRSSVVGSLPEKVFRNRDSPLTELLKVPHFQAIHHIFFASLSLFMIHTLVIDLIETGSVDFGVDMLLWAFGNRQATFVILGLMHFSSIFILYPSFHFWATWRPDYDHESRLKLDMFAGGAFVTFMLGFIFIPATIMWNNPLPPASGCVVTMEQCRLLMKMYAFVRTCVPRVLAQTPAVQPAKPNQESEVIRGTAVIRRRHQETELLNQNGNGTPTDIVCMGRKRRESWISWDQEEDGCPGFSKYLYFLVCPTLIYKDSYPMRKKIRWTYVCWNLGQCIGCIVYANFLLSRVSPIFFTNFGKPSYKMNLTQLVHALFSMMLPGTLCLMLAFFCILHGWQNAFAEMLYFGDRLFYKDWWNQASFSAYYKTWNIIVHDWLYTYVFKDACEFGLASIWRPLPTFLVFVISSLFHEYILSFSFNFFFPVLLTLFGGFGFPFVFLKSRKNAFGNVLMWMALISGTGIILTLYTMEFYARRNCPPVNNFDFFKPRVLTCSAFTFSW